VEVKCSVTEIALAKRPQPTLRMPPINNLQDKFAGAVTDQLSNVFRQHSVEFQLISGFLA
jgi:hypothetical protein